jgi:hypothetical protein
VEHFEATGEGEQCWCYAVVLAVDGGVLASDDFDVHFVFLCLICGLVLLY